MFDFPFFGVGAGLGLAGSLIGANAQRQAANATLGALQPSKDELALRASALKASQDLLSRQEELLNSIDPALREAGRQALQLLQGKPAAALAPLQNEIARQRGSTRARLLRQLGSGAGASTPGIQAQTEFERQAGLALNQAQQEALGQLLQTSLAGRQLAPAGLQSSQGLLGLLGQERQNVANAQQLRFLPQLSIGQLLGNLGQSAISIGTLNSLRGSNTNNTFIGATDAFTQTAQNTLANTLSDFNRNPTGGGISGPSLLGGLGG